MNDAHVVEFSQLAGADLVIDRIYRGGAFGGTADDPLSKLLRVGNRGGFRPAGSPKKDSVKLAVLYTTGSEPDWPDALDPYTGTFTYYGDNRRPGQALESTMGNLLLRKAFAWAHGDAAARARVAGTGIIGNSGDDGPATDAQLNSPFGVAVTADGGFLIADRDNTEIRKVESVG